MGKLLAGLLCGFLCSVTYLQAAPEVATPILKMATTTSTDNSGLLSELLPRFEAESGYSVQVIAVGTGKALKMGEDGDVDVVLVHAPSAEQVFVEQGFGIERHAVMYNDFVVLGPKEDPAGVQQAADLGQVMQKLAKTEALFVSRGDDSGTHKKERKLWDATQLQPQGSWYREAGQGMGKVIQMAGELAAYTLADRGTWLAMAAKSPLQIVFEGDASLHNPYGVIAVSPKRYPDINHAGAQALISWLTSTQGQQAIADFRVNGEPLFTPSAAKQQADAAQAQ